MIKNEDNWEQELDENVASIRKSSADIQRSFSIIMGLMILWIGIEIGTML